MGMEYKTLSDEDKLILAKDRLRGVESDHFRLSLTEEPQKQERLEQLEESQKRAIKEVNALKKIIENTPPENKYKDQTKEELVALAEERGLEVKASLKKAEIIEALVADDE